MTPNQLFKRIQVCEKIKQTDYENIQFDNKTDALIKSNIFLCHPDTLYFFEVHKPDHYILSIVEKQFLMHFKKGKKYNIILDLSRAKKPVPEIREKLKAMFSSDYIKMIYIYVGKNIIIKLFAKFMVGAMLNRESITFVSSREEAYNLSLANAN